MAYLTIAEAVKKYDKSESTLRRLIRDVRKGSDERKRRLLTPSEQEIEQHRKTGEPFTYKLADQLLDRELTEQDTQQGTEVSAPAKSSGQQDAYQTLVEKMQQRYEQEIERLEKLLGEEKREKDRLLERAQEDKKMFAQASSNLTQVVMRLPEVADAGASQPKRPVEGNAVESKPKPQTQSSRPKTGKKASSNKPKKQPESKSFFARLLPRR